MDVKGTIEILDGSPDADFGIFGSDEPVLCSFLWGDIQKMLVLAGLMSLYTSIMYFIYFWRSASRSFLYYFPALLMAGLFWVALP